MEEGQRSRWAWAWKLAFAILCWVVFSLLSAGLILLVARPPAGQPVVLLLPPSPAPVVVHVTGAVQQPGVYTLPSGSRVQDAILAAGGLTAQADAAALNLAAPLEDGARLQVPALLPAATARTPGGAATPTAPEAEPATRLATLDPGHPININTATQEELESLPYIGPATAKKIIAYREANGPFKTVDDILKVFGVGPKTLEQIRPYITVDILPQ